MGMNDFKLICCLDSNNNMRERERVCVAVSVSCVQVTADAWKQEAPAVLYVELAAASK